MSAADKPPPMSQAEFVTICAASMAQMAEVYRSAIDAGFTDAQAMAIVLEMVRMGAERA